VDVNDLNRKFVQFHVPEATIHVTSNWMLYQTVIIDLLLCALDNVMFLVVDLRWSQTLKAWMASAQNFLNCCYLYSLPILHTLWIQQLQHPLFPPHRSTRKLSLYRSTQIQPFMDINSMLSEKQSGFRKIGVVLVPILM